jgi:hypothetical protein
LKMFLVLGPWTEKNLFWMSGSKKSRKRLIEEACRKRGLLALKGRSTDVLDARIEASDVWRVDEPSTVKRGNKLKKEKNFECRNRKISVEVYTVEIVSG